MVDTDGKLRGHISPVINEGKQAYAATLKDKPWLRIRAHRGVKQPPTRFLWFSLAFRFALPKMLPKKDSDQ